MAAPHHSPYWKALILAHDVVLNKFQWHVGTGETISVADLISTRDTWNLDLIKNFLPPFKIQAILAIPFVSIPNQHYWLSSTGQCTSVSAYSSTHLAMAYLPAVALAYAVPTKDYLFPLAAQS
ncbi:hypothetical protein ACH5RR_031601 [Cinchona calisaya]|uniref:Uncharacterized protein n=1 Tax=Cinchona calisaya TaxID=153742 RepID=A0ABD2YFQ3_9GENT